MADIFISYAREDREMAKRFAEAIESRGWTVWWDRRIPAGKSYEDVIDQEIDAATCMVVLWTRRSVASEWVRNEAGEAARRHALIPIRLEDVRLPLAYRHLQFADLLTWAPAEFDVCVASIESMIGAPTTPPKHTSEAKIQTPPIAPAGLETSQPTRLNEADAEPTRPITPPPFERTASDQTVMTSAADPSLPPRSTSTSTNGPIPSLGWQWIGWIGTTVLGLVTLFLIIMAVTAILK